MKTFRFVRTTINSKSPEFSNSDVRTKNFRGDIQALRAFAVLVVALNHLWPARLTGGFIGVDVFFVISGFLISTHLMKYTLDSQCRLNLLSFYARRIRRLLPAAFFVLAVSFIGVLIWVPLDQWKQNFTEIFTSSSYVQNLYLTARAVDYHAQGQSATVAQHYWSLSVEEQFYIVWPWILLGLAWIAKNRAKKVRAVTAIGMGIFVVVFFAFSVWYTASDFNRAYFFTPVRVWEFAAGGLIAAIAPWLSNKFAPLTRLIVALVGWTMMVCAALTFTGETFFPGYAAALPVVGAALVIVAGTGTTVLGLNYFTSLPPVRWLGDVSYSVYLWHWPLIVISPYILHTTLFWPHKLGIFALTLLLAGFSKPFLEDYWIHSRWFGERIRRAFIFMLCGIILLATAWVCGNRAVDQINSKEQARIKTALEADCVGPAALLLPSCSSHLYDYPIYTSMGDDTIYYTAPPSAEADESNVSNEAFLGKTTYDLRKDKIQPVQSEDRIVLVGDSHAQQWLWPMYEIAKANHKVLETYFMGGCAVFGAENTAQQQAYDEAAGKPCGAGAGMIVQQIAQSNPSVVVYSTYGKDEWLPGTGTQQEIYNVGLGRAWQTWLDAGVKHIYVIADVPYNEGVRDVSCFKTASNPAYDCRVDRKTALGNDPLPIAVDVAANSDISLIDFTDAYCDNNYCYAVVGGLPVYYDTTHLNREYALKLAPILADYLQLKAPSFSSGVS